jgi:methionyl-tRNA formyltransferase
MVSENNWPALDQYGMLLVNNNRSKAYLQNLIRNGHIPSAVVLLDAGAVVLPEHTDNDQIHSSTKQKFIRKCPEAGISFDEKEHVQATLEKHRIPYELISSLDVNSEVVVDAVRNCAGHYMVYSGPGGTILRQDILSTGKHFLHVHPGWLPDYCGSTTLYYSMLAGDAVGCSVITMIDEIDKGPVFHRRKFYPSPLTDLDYVLDPAIRAATLIDFFNTNRDRSPTPLSITDEDKMESDLFFIIHPVLKHLSILSLT